MKKIFILLLLAVFAYTAQSQKVTNYIIKLDNGIVVTMEHDWSNVWVSQTTEPMSGTDVVAVNIRTLGDLLTGSTIKMFSGTKEARMKDAVPGTYTLKITSKLSGKPGLFSYEVPDIVVKPKMKTTVSITVYKYQTIIEEAPAANKGLAYYESKVLRFKGNTEHNLNWGIPTFYAKGAHDKKIAPDEPMGDSYGKIKPGTYDVLITIEVSGYVQKVWLNNFQMKPDVSYKISTNLNGGEVYFTSGPLDIKSIGLYPAGTAAKKTGTPAPDKALLFISYEGPGIAFACPPGSFDVLLTLGKGNKYEWRKGIVVRTGVKTEVK